MATLAGQGGKDALARYLAANLHYTDEARSNALEGVVLIAFQVREDGRPFGFEVVETPHTLLSACALTTLKDMPDWIPAQRGGQPVVSKVMLPLQFSLR